MKARYTPLQTAVASVEESHSALLEASPGSRPDAGRLCAAALHDRADRGGREARGGRTGRLPDDGWRGPPRRVLPARATSSATVGLLDGWITCGQAFGGELEAVTVWSGLLAAKELLEAEVIVVADGPGNLGTDTTWGVSALASGHALMAAATLGGRPIPALRVSFADERERHRAVSHHSLTILADVCKVDVNVPVPVLEDEAQRASVRECAPLAEAGGDPPARRGGWTAGAGGAPRPRPRRAHDGTRDRRRSRVLPRGRGGRCPRRPAGRREPPLAATSPREEACRRSGSTGARRVQEPPLSNARPSPCPRRSTS